MTGAGMTPEEILHEAQVIINRDGWFQGGHDDGDRHRGRVCLMGAINRAATGSSNCYKHEPDGVATVHLDGPMPEVNEAVKRVMNAIGTDAVGSWNDERHRSVEDVLLALKKAESEET